MCEHTDPIKTHTQLGNYADVVKITATHCVVCRRELTDAESVEHGIGPKCSRRYYNPLFIPTPTDVQRALGSLAVSGLPEHVVDAVVEREHKAREACNILVYWASAHYDDKDVVFACSAVIRDFGYVELAEKLETDRTKVGLRFGYENNDKIVIVTSTTDKWDTKRDYQRLGGKPLAREHGKYRWAFPLTKQEQVEAVVGYRYGGQLGVVAEGIYGRTRSGIFTIPRKSHGDYQEALYGPRQPAPTPQSNTVLSVQTTPQGNVKVVFPGGDKFQFHGPKNPAWMSAMKDAIPYRKRRWDWDLFCWVFDASVRQTVLDLVEKHYGVTL